MSAGIRNSISAVLKGSFTRIEKAAQIAELIREAGKYRWVGMYDVGPETVSIIAYSGPGAPAYPQFSVTNELTGAAIREKKTVVSGDVANDPRYLTAFESTGSEIIVPVLDEAARVVLGTIDVESQNLNAFSAEDQRTLEEYALASRSLWIET